MNKNPIAVIDSGVGGLACIEEIRKAMPTEDIIYLGDTAFMPFGTKTNEELNIRSEKIAKALDAMGVKMIIIACNTLSTVCLDTFYKTCPMMLCQGMVEPLVRSVIKNINPGEKLGLIATPRCVESKAYDAAFAKTKKNPELISVGIPELSVFVENGIVDGPQMEHLLHSYMDSMVNERGATSLVLGCTHYPLVTECIHKLYPDLQIINPAKDLATCSMQLLGCHELDNPEGNGSLSLYTTKTTQGFANMATRLGLGDCEIKEINI